MVAALDHQSLPWGTGFGAAALGRFLAAVDAIHLGGRHLAQFGAGGRFCTILAEPAADSDLEAAAAAKASSSMASTCC